MFPFAEFFSTLTKGVKAALPSFRALAETSKGVNEIIREVREAGFSFREQQARDVIGVLRNNIENKQTQARIARISGKDTPLDTKHYGLTIGRPLRNFSYTVRRTLRGVVSGQHDISHVTVSSNTPLSVNQILDTAGLFTTGSCNPLFEEVETVEMSVVEALRSPDYEV